MDNEIKIYKSRILNALGAQLARIIFHRSARQICRRKAGQVCQVADALERDGYAIINKFLPDDEFAAVKKEFRLAVGNPRFITRLVVDTVGILRISANVTAESERYFPETLKAFRSSARVQSAISAYYGSAPAETQIQVSFWRTQATTNLPDKGIEYSDHTNTELHSDSYRSIIKGFFYLHDTDVDAGAHVYVPRSHRLSVRRLAFEYLNSVGRMEGSPRLSAWLRALLEPERALVLPANSLIIEDTFGFHAAGMPQADVPRDLIYFQFRGAPRANVKLRSVFR